MSLTVPWQHKGNESSSNLISIISPSVSELFCIALDVDSPIQWDFHLARRVDVATCLLFSTGSVQLGCL